MLILRHFSKATKSTPLAVKHLLLDELRRTWAVQFSGASDMDGKLKQLLNSASLILSIVTTLQIATGIKQIGWLYLAGLALALTLYVVLMIVIMYGLRPTTYHSPVPPDWHEITENYFFTSEDKALDLLISAYFQGLDKNDVPITNKSNAVKLASVLLVAIVIVLIVMGVFGLSSGMTFPWQNPPPTPTPTP